MDETNKAWKLDEARSEVFPLHRSIDHRISSTMPWLMQRSTKMAWSETEHVAQFQVNASIMALLSCFK
jgi:hypothetical protein